jgi:hypothetical protein
MYYAWKKFLDKKSSPNIPNDWHDAAIAFKNEHYIRGIKDDKAFGIFFAGYKAALNKSTQNS